MFLIVAKYSILEAVRDKFFIFIVLGESAFFILALFIGELAITEGVSTQVAIMASALRLFAVFTISLFVISSIWREFNDKGIELILSHPLPRTSYFIGKYIGFSFIAFMTVLLSLFFLCVFVSINSALLWVFSLFCELLIIIALSLLCSFSFNSITISFSVVMMFYLLSRLIEVFQLIGDSPVLASGSVGNQFMTGLLDIIAYVMPELHQFTKTEWLVYLSETTVAVWLIPVHTIVYVCLLSSAALFDLYRKEL